MLWNHDNSSGTPWRHHVLPQDVWRQYGVLMFLGYVKILKRNRSVRACKALVQVCPMSGPSRSCAQAPPCVHGFLTHRFPSCWAGTWTGSLRGVRSAGVCTRSVTRARSACPTWAWTSCSLLGFVALGCIRAPTSACSAQSALVMCARWSYTAYIGKVLSRIRTETSSKGFPSGTYSE